MPRLALALLTVALALAAAFWYRDQDPARVNGESAMMAALVAMQPRRLEDRPHSGRLRFPEDHGKHGQYPAESWRIIGNLRDPKDRRFGLDFGILRLAFGGKETERRASAWAAREVFVGRLAVSDSERARVYSDERTSRAALGLAGYRARPALLWLEDWRLGFRSNATFVMDLAAAAGKLRVQLTLRATRAPLAAGLAPRDWVSYLTNRLLVRGTITIGKAPHSVSGTAMLEHAWGRLPPLGGQLRWERYYLNLDDGRDLVLTRLARRDGSGAPVPGGLILLPGGDQQTLMREQLAIETLKEWESPSDGRRYPSRWRISLPGSGTVLRVEPTMADQEARGFLRRWVGAVRIEGQARERPIAGEGYVELLGW